MDWGAGALAGAVVDVVVGGIGTVVVVVEAAGGAVVVVVEAAGGAVVVVGATGTVEAEDCVVAGLSATEDAVPVSKPTETIAITAALVITARRRLVVPIWRFPLSAPQSSREPPQPVPRWDTRFGSPAGSRSPVALRPLLAKGLPFRRFRHRHRTAEVLHGCNYECGIPDR